ncbi:hypothetical protein O997_03505 [Anaplasma phagocytophilum str. MRK]|nr:hypothetical protein O997_03505 [Anaplasma phagocytophilum str. MRK]
MLDKEKTCSGVGCTLEYFPRSVYSFFCICIICCICDYVIMTELPRKVLACEAIILSKVTVGNLSFSFVSWLRALAITNASMAFFESYNNEQQRVVLLFKICLCALSHNGV